LTTAGWRSVCLVDLRRWPGHIIWFFQDIHHFQVKPLASKIITRIIGITDPKTLDGDGYHVIVIRMENF